MKTDVLIIGSGPAGSSAARELTGSGLDVILLERLSDERFSVYHSVCGEAVSSRMISLNDIAPSHRVKDVDGITIASSGGTETVFPIKGSIVDRPRMLADIRGGCDAKLIRGTAVRVSEDDDGFIVDTTAGEIRCRYLIGADGAHSVVRRDIFGTKPAGMLPMVNTIEPGEQDDLLFIVGSEFGGCYAWRFPSHEGFVSVGMPKGVGESGKAVSRGARHLPFGGVPEAVRGNAFLVGDAAGLANALCYGGIGVAMLSGRKAAAAVKAGDPGKYRRWYDRCIYRNPHFMEAHRLFSEWDDSDIRDAMAPLEGRVSVFKGFVAMVRRPRYKRIYLAVWLGFRYGW